MPAPPAFPAEDTWRISRYLSPLWPILLLILILLGGGCGTRGPLEVNGTESRLIAVELGREFRIRLRTTGPGEYASPPAVSDSTVRFIESSYVSPSAPGGPTQLFRFATVFRGRTVATFQHTEGGYSVSDTILVY